MKYPRVFFFCLPFSLFSAVLSSGGLAFGMTGDARVTGEASLVEDRRGAVSLRVLEPSGRAVLTFDYGRAPLDLSAHRDIAVPIANDTSAELDVLLQAASNLKDIWRHRTSGRFLVRPGEKSDLTALLPRKALAPDHPHVQRFGNLFAFPWGHHRHWLSVDAAALVQVSLRIEWRNARTGQVIRVERPRGRGEISSDPALLEGFEFPMVDELGQARWLDWPGKVRGIAELREDGRKDLAAADRVSGPGEGRDRFGGLTGGPQLEATGFFRVEKFGGKWWFVDPEGKLFWSLGVNCVGASANTRVKGREKLFPSAWSGREDIALYDNNLEAKYGAEDWKQKSLEVTLGRLFRWGLNTIGAWSKPDFARSQRIPYTLIIHNDMQGLGSTEKIPDPYAPAFGRSLDDLLRKASAEHARSPWLVGVFIDNELEWHGDNRLVKDIMQSPAGTPARTALLDFLRQRHGEAGNLNKAWGTDFRDFAEVKLPAGGEETAACRQDLDDFLGLFAERYFSACRSAMDRHFPDHLYLGCRFHVRNPVITKAASRYCDVLSVNVYQHSLEGFAMETAEDRPWLISEYHFGVRDHGNLGVGLTWASDARNQADVVQAYLSEALDHPNFVGAHWFMWVDQGVTGRADGENFGVGLVTVTDRPVETLAAAMRGVADGLPASRLGRAQGRAGGGKNP